MNLIKKDKKISLIVCVGLSSIALALIFLLLTIMAIRDQEIILATQDLGVQVRPHEEALQRLKNVYVTTIIPVTGILTIFGVAFVLIPQLHGFAQNIALRKLKLTDAEEKTVSRWDNVKEEPVVVLQKLMRQEANLNKEKKNLVSFREKWELKVKKDIENKQNSIRKLRAEINDLKFVHEELLKSSKIRAQMK